MRKRKRNKSVRLCLGWICVVILLLKGHIWSSDSEDSSVEETKLCLCGGMRPWLAPSLLAVAQPAQAVSMKPVTVAVLTWLPSHVFETLVIPFIISNLTQRIGEFCWAGTPPTSPSFQTAASAGLRLPVCKYSWVIVQACMFDFFCFFFYLMWLL